MISYSWQDIKKFSTDKRLISWVLGIVSLLSVTAIIRFLKKKFEIRELEKIRTKLNRERDMKFEKFLSEHGRKVTTEKQIKIINSTISELVNLVKSKKITCKEIIITYGIRTASYGRDLNLVADVDLESAYKQAIEHDNKVVEGKELGPLHGIPFSVYEQISVKGMLTTCGYISKSQNVNIIDSLIVKVLGDHGAIPFIKSNIPQGFMALETSNFLWGTAKNPWNEEKTTGGSNGGEAGLVVTKCSAFGIGSDRFGSLRIPCSFTGAYGFKPTSSRNSKHGATLFNGSNFSGFTTLNTSLGPICRSMKDLILVSKCLFGNFSQDVYVHNTIFNEESFSRVIDNNNKPMKIGYFLETKDCPTAPAIKEVMENVIRELKKSGYHLHEFPLDRFDEFIILGQQLLINSEIVKDIKDQLNGESLAKCYQGIDCLYNTNSIFRNFIYKWKCLQGKKREANMIKNFKKMDKSEFLRSTKRYMELKDEFINYWKTFKFEAIISPVFPTLALEHGISEKFLPFNHMAYIYNFADLPSVTIPITLNSNLEYDDSINDNISLIIKNNMANSINLPVSIQIGTLPNQDELALRLAKEIDCLYRYDEKFANELLKKFPVNSY